MVPNLNFRNFSINQNLLLYSNYMYIQLQNLKLHLLEWYLVDYIFWYNSLKNNSNIKIK